MAKGSKPKASSSSIRKFEVYLIKDNSFVSKEEFSDREQAESFVKEYSSTHTAPEYATIVY